MTFDSNFGKFDISGNGVVSTDLNQLFSGESVSKLVDELQIVLDEACNLTKLNFANSVET